MSISMYNVMCKGFMEDCAPERVEVIYGKILYPGGDICDWFTHACDFNCWFRPWTECYRYDLSALTLGGHEVACAYADLGGLATNAQYHILAKWYDQDGDHLFTNQSGYITKTERYRWVCWIGYCDWEIIANGWHKVILELFEDDSLVKSKTINFEIVGVPVVDPCEGVVCDDICVGDDLWSQECIPEGVDAGKCAVDQLIEADSPTCGFVPPPPPADGDIKYITVPAEASEGDSIDLCATIENVGGSSGMFFLRFYDGATMVRETSPGNVAAGQTITDICEYFTMPGHAWTGKIKLMRQT
jgi:hypothetical protein